ncbi:MAG: hypothetical protein WDO70_10510 [Alphaproteobacteria bacterium]
MPPSISDSDGPIIEAEISPPADSAVAPDNKPSLSQQSRAPVGTVSSGMKRSARAGILPPLRAIRRIQAVRIDAPPVAIEQPDVALEKPVPPLKNDLHALGMDLHGGMGMAARMMLQRQNNQNNSPAWLANDPRLRRPDEPFSYAKRRASSPGSARGVNPDAYEPPFYRVDKNSKEVMPTGTGTGIPVFSNESICAGINPSFSGIIVKMRLNY